MLWSKIGIIFDRFLDILMYTACTLLIFAMLLTSADVIRRYALNKSMGWSIEVTEFFLVGIVSLGIAWLLKEEGHVKVDFLLDWLNPKTRNLVIGITSAIGALAVLLIVYYGFQESINMMQMGARRTGILRLPKAYWLFPLVFGCFLFAIQLLRRSYTHLRDWRTIQSLRTLTKGGKQHWNGS